MATKSKRKSEPGERVHLGFRVTPEMKRRVEDAAHGSGRSISQEAELRLERSFEQQRLLPEVLELAYGTELAGLLIAVAEAMNEAQLAGQIMSLEDHPKWSDDPFSFDTVAVAAQAVLHALFEAMRPAGAIRNPPDSAKLGQAMADRVLYSLTDDRARSDIKNAKHARDLLGPAVVKRLKGKRP